MPRLSSTAAKPAKPSKSAKPAKLAKPPKPAKSAKPAKPAKKKQRRSKFIEESASESGSCAGESDDEVEEPENDEDRNFRDDGPVKERRARLPRIRPEETVVSDDELENLKDDCISLCTAGKGKPKKRRILTDSEDEDKPKKNKKKNKVAYADADDLKNAHESDLDWLATSSEEDEKDLSRTEEKAGELIKDFLTKKGLARPALSAAEEHMEARRNAYENTRNFLRAQRAGAAAGVPDKPQTKPAVSGTATAILRREVIPKPNPDASVPQTSKVRQTEANRKVAPLFLGPAASALAAKKTAASGPKEPGLVINASTKEVHYRHRDGRLSPRKDTVGL